MITRGLHFLFIVGHWTKGTVDRHWWFNLLWRPGKHKAGACSEASITSQTVKARLILCPRMFIYIFNSPT